MAGIFLLLQLLILGFQFPPAECKAQPVMCTITDPSQFPYKCHQSGDLFIGAIVSMSGCLFDDISFSEHPKTKLWDELVSIPKNYQHVLSLVFAVKEINENLKILPNVSLGFHIYDSYFSARMTHQNTLKLLSTQERIVPNFKCDKHKHLVAVIGALDLEISLHMAFQLYIYKIPQIAYCALAPATNVKIQLPSFYRMVPNEAYQYQGIVHLFHHFQWTWVGILAPDDDNGETFVRTMMKTFSDHGICTAFSTKLPAIPDVTEILKLLNTLEVEDHVVAWFKSLFSSEVKVYVVNAESVTTIILAWFIHFYTMLKRVTETSIGKVWIMTSQWDFALLKTFRNLDIQVFHGALSFAIHSREMLRFSEFLKFLHPKSQEGDDFIKIIWEQAFDCLFSDSDEGIESRDTCTGEERLENLPGTLFEKSMTGQSYSIYNAVHAVAHALQKMLSFRIKHKTIVNKCSLSPSDLQCFQLHPFLKSISFNNSAGDTVSFDEEGELVGGFDLINWVTFPNQTFLRVKAGMMDPQASPDKEFTIYEKAITWHNIFNQVESDYQLKNISIQT